MSFFQLFCYIYLQKPVADKFEEIRSIDKCNLELDIKAAKKEVFQYAMASLEKVDKETAQLDRLIKLGAKVGQVSFITAE